MTGELHRGEAPRRLSDITNTGPGPSQGGSFSFDEATMRSLVQDWLALADDYELSLRSSDSMVQIVPPGDEFASRGHAKAANDSGKSYLDYLQHNRQYCLDQAQLFQNAVDDYLGVERTNLAEMHKTTDRGV